MTDIGRENISKAMKKFYENNIDRHPYKLYNSRKESYPERVFRECLEKNNIEGWIQEMQFSRYRADFTFVEYKLIVEIDGRFHDLQKVIEKDIIRTEYLNSLGYRVIRFKAGRINTETYQCLNDVLEILGEKQIEIPKEYLEKRKIKEFLKQNKPIIKRIYKKPSKKEKNNIIEKILNSNIDFSKKGWINELSKFLNYSYQGIVKFMKTNLEDFYIEKCYKQIQYNKKEISSKQVKEKIKIVKEKTTQYLDSILVLNKNLVLNSNIDFSKKGWINELSKVLEYSIQATVRWMKKNMKDFYEEKCYKSKYVLVNPRIKE